MCSEFGNFSRLNLLRFDRFGNRLGDGGVRADGGNFTAGGGKSRDIAGKNGGEAGEKGGNFSVFLGKAPILPEAPLPHETAFALLARTLEPPPWPRTMRGRLGHAG